MPRRIGFGSLVCVWRMVYYQTRTVHRLPTTLVVTVSNHSARQFVNQRFVCVCVLGATDGSISESKHISERGSEEGRNQLDRQPGKQAHTHTHASEAVRP